MQKQCTFCYVFISKIYRIVLTPKYKRMYERSVQKINPSSLLRIGPIPTINKWFWYIPENESKGEILGWTKSLVISVHMKTTESWNQTGWYFHITENFISPVHYWIIYVDSAHIIYHNILICHIGIVIFHILYMLPWSLFCDPQHFEI